jgi:hypothetical protein
MVMAVLGSAAMAAATVLVVVFHALMFNAANRGVSHAVAAPYLWVGTVEAALTAAAAGVLYQLPWRRLSTGRIVVVALGAAALLLAVGSWIAFWSAS